MVVIKIVSYICIKQNKGTMSTIKLSTIEAYRSERENANAKGDCAVRAFATFFDISYEAARTKLNEFNGSRDCVRGTLGSAIYRAALKYGSERGIEITKHSLGRRQAKVKNIVNSEDKALIIARGHATACMNGVHYGNLTQEDSDSKKYRNDDNQYVVEYYTMKIFDLNKYLSGGVI